MKTAILWILLLCFVSLSLSARFRKNKTKKWWKGATIDLGRLDKRRKFVAFITPYGKRVLYKEAWKFCKKAKGKLAWTDSYKITNRITAGLDKKSKKLNKAREKTGCFWSSMYWVGAKHVPPRGNQEDVDTWILVSNARTKKGSKIKRKWTNFQTYIIGYPFQAHGPAVYLQHDPDYAKFGGWALSRTACSFICEFTK